MINAQDALTPKRDRGHRQESRLVAQLLTLMDGLESRGRLIVLAATNRPNALDPALRRPGRFDREIYFEPPNESDRLTLLQQFTASMPLEPQLSLESIAQSTQGYVAADLSALCREAAQLALQSPASTLTVSHFQNALKTSGGPSANRSFQLQLDSSLTWSSIGGLKDIKREIQQWIQWPLLYSESMERLGVRPPRGILFYGPPGCSKTTIAKVIYF